MVIKKMTDKEMKYDYLKFQHKLLIVDSIFIVLILVPLLLVLTFLNFFIGMLLSILALGAVAYDYYIIHKTEKELGL